MKMLHEYRKVIDSLHDAEIDFSSLYCEHSFDAKLIRSVAQNPTLVNNIISFLRYLDQFYFFKDPFFCLHVVKTLEDDILPRSVAGGSRVIYPELLETPSFKAAYKDTDTIRHDYFRLKKAFEAAGIDPIEYYCPRRKSKNIIERVKSVPDLFDMTLSFLNMVYKYLNYLGEVIHLNYFFCLPLIDWLSHENMLNLLGKDV